MTPNVILRGHRVGAQPATRTTEPHTIILGPDLPHAACKGLAPLFDRTIPHERPHDRDERHRLAIRVCRRCPELADCLNARLNQPELGDGIWGGQEFARCRCGTTFTTTPHIKTYCTDRCVKRAENRRRGVAA